MSNSIDYNEKFKVLGNKIAKIRTETKNNIALSNAYLSRLNNIEEKAQKRINNLDKSFSTLKDQYLKLTSQYDTNSQYYKTQGQVNLFKNSSTKIKAQLQSQRENLSEFIDSTFETIEKVLNKKKVYDDNDIEQFSKHSDGMTENIAFLISDLSSSPDLKPTAEILSTSLHKSFSGPVPAKMNCIFFNSRQVSTRVCIPFSLLSRPKYNTYFLLVSFGERFVCFSQKL